MVQHFQIIFNCFFCNGLCLLMSVTYVASLHIWNSPYNRDHPSTIKKRFLSVFVMSFISPLFLSFGMSKDILEKVSICELMGFKTKGLLQALTLPLLLTVILFLGPVAMKLSSGILKLCTDPSYWINNFKDLIWLRNHLVAPFSEEFTYRSCMMPLLLQCFSPMTTVLVCPLFFGVAHFHHLRERTKYGMDWKVALQLSCFQFVYTTIFGIYSAYLLLRTGHFAATFVAHAFCNHMGFPDVVEVAKMQGAKKVVIIGLYFLGFVSWCLLLSSLTEPTLYYNNRPWYTIQ